MSRMVIVDRVGIDENRRVAGPTLRIKSRREASGASVDKKAVSQGHIGRATRVQVSIRKQQKKRGREGGKKRGEKTGGALRVARRLRRKYDQGCSPRAEGSSSRYVTQDKERGTEGTRRTRSKH